MIIAHAKYKNGFFYEIDTGNPVEFKDNSEYLIYAPSLKTLKIKEKKKSQKPLNAAEKKVEIESKKEIGEFRKILDAGTNLYFDIYHHGDNNQFNIILLEDLYLYNMQTWNNTLERLFPCKSKLISISGNKKEIAEEIYATSLNELYKITYVYFFGNDGNPASNAFNKFYTQKTNALSLLRFIRDK